jgi:hypothetical protein
MRPPFSTALPVLRFLATGILTILSLCIGSDHYLCSAVAGADPTCRELSFLEHV